jgi:hypothetical protein
MLKSRGVPCCSQVERFRSSSIFLLFPYPIFQIQGWVESVIGESFPGSFSESLKDGVILCKLLGALKPGEYCVLLGAYL